MNNDMQAMIVGLIIKVGIDAAIHIIENLSKAVTIDDAIAALKASQAKIWEDYKKEA